MHKRWRTLLLGFFLLQLVAPQHVHAGERRPSWKNCRWKSQVQRKGLWLTRTYRKRLILASTSKNKPRLSSQHRRINRKYGQLRSTLSQVRRCYKRQFQRARSYRVRVRRLRNIERNLVAILDNVTLPLWIGTTWDFYGTATSPHQKSIACGYFFVHALRSIGFRFPQNFLYRSKKKGPMRIYKFAKQSATTMARILSKPSQRYVTSRKPIRTLMKPLKKFGPGLYILGLDSHVGLVLFNGKKAYFWHSNYAEPQAWVKRENLFHSPVAIDSNYRMLAKVHRSWIRKWLYRTPIRVP